MAESAPPRTEPLAVVLAVKELAHAKSRLTGRDVPPHERPALVAAMFADTVEAVRAAGPAVIAVVSPDPALRSRAAELGALIVDDPGDGLNAALVAGAAAAYARLPIARVAFLQADLPALRTDSLVGALSAAAPHRAAFVADRDGTGTVLLTGAPGLTPAFGAGSATAHRDSGAVELDRAARRWPDLRTDVDTVADLAQARRLGLGQHTAHEVRRWDRMER